MNNEERKQEWIRKTTIEHQAKHLSKHRCDKCGCVDFGYGNALDLKFLCLNCMGDVLFKKPDLDVKDFARI